MRFEVIAKCRTKLKVVKWAYSGVYLTQTNNVKSCKKFHEKVKQLTSEFSYTDSFKAEWCTGENAPQKTEGVYT